MKFQSSTDHTASLFGHQVKNFASYVMYSAEEKSAVNKDSWDLQPDQKEEKINLWSVQCNKHCLFVPQTVEPPSTTVRNYSHIFLFVPAFIEQQLFSPLGYPLQAWNFF